MIKYFLKRQNDAEFKEVARSEYLHHQKQAGYYVGNMILHSFHDRDQNISGQAKEIKKWMRG